MAGYIKVLVAASVNYFQSTLKVSPVRSNIILNTKKVCSFTTPSLYLTSGVEGDLVIFVHAVYDNQSYVAAARPCMLVSPTNRPLVGELFFNLRIVKKAGLFA
jgi:hypothetical protein